MTEKICAYELWDREVRCRDWCTGHYYQQYLGKPLTPLRGYKNRPKAPAGYAYCNACESFKKESDFWKTPAGKTRSRCKKCMYAAEKARTKASAA